MALAAVQAAAARLCTDSAARRLLREEPESFAREMNLELEELGWLREIAEGFEKFSRSLWNKRAGEAEGAFPRTRKALGESFTAAFRKFADAVPVAANPMLDALAFLDALRAGHETPQMIRDLASFEAAALRFRLSNDRFRIRIFRFCDMTPFFVVAVWRRASLNGEVRLFTWPRRRS